MTFDELLVHLKELSHDDKRRVIRFLGEIDFVALCESGVTFEVWSPECSPEGVKAMKQLLAEDRHLHSQPNRQEPNG